METSSERNEKKKVRDGLNRTMQYGNKILTQVWHECLLRLNRTMQYGNEHIFHRMERKPPWFKSYYVVWKLAKTDRKKNTQECLNRTMQYGNGDDSMPEYHHMPFKSYYVVWKPTTTTMFAR